MENQKPKSFWEKPEGKTGGVLLVAIIGAIGVGIYKLLPYLITLMQNVLYLSLLGVGFAALLYVLFDKTFRNNIWTLYKMAMRKMTGMVVELDPIAIQEMHIKTLQDKREEMNAHLILLNGSRASLTNTIQQNEKARIEALKIANEAQKQADTNSRMKNQMIFETNEAGRLQAANDEIKPVQNTINILYETLSKVYDDSEWLIKDLISQTKINKEKYKAINEGVKTVNAAGKFFNSNDEENNQFLMSLEVMEQQTNDRIGQIDRFMSTTTTIMDSIDLKNCVMQEDGLKMLKEFQSQDYSSLLKPINSDNKINLDIPQAIPMSKSGLSNNKFDGLI